MISRTCWFFTLVLVALLGAGCATAQPAATPVAAMQTPGAEATTAVSSTADAVITSTTPPTDTFAPTSTMPLMETAGGPPAGGMPGGGPPAGFGEGHAFTATAAFADLAYADTSATQTLDIYLPECEGPFPVVVNFHAGGFKFMDKTAIPGAIGAALLNAGYAVVGVNYRLSGEATFPAAVLDARAAVRYLRANAAKYNLDPERMAAFGQSAGGNLAAMVGTTAESDAFDDAGLGNADVSNAVQAVVNWFGPTDFGVMDEQAAAQGCSANDQTHSRAESFESAYLGAEVASSPELVAQANPITYIDGSEPPFLIQKGDQDCTVAVANTQMLADALEAAGVTVEFTLLPGVGHGDTGDTPVFEGEENIQKVIDFLDRYLQ